jgi:hypothetical protein
LLTNSSTIPPATANPPMTGGRAIVYSAILEVGAEFFAHFVEARAMEQRRKEVAN